MNTAKPLFSVVIVHYNQPQYIKTAVDSVLAQDYPNIQLTVADDASAGFDAEGLCSYIEQHKQNSLRKFDVYSNQQNVGTVRNLNRAIKEAQGEYILFFAADDALYNNEVLSRFAAAIEQLEPEALCVSAQCAMMDDQLRERLGDFTDVNRAAQLNHLGAAAQFENLMSSAFYGLGSSAFRRADFERFGAFDETYHLVEDWSYFLSQTRAGRAVHFENFYALLHREGGVSHNQSPVEPAYVRVFKDDILKINEKEILPYLRRLPLAKQVKTLNEYEAVRNAYRAQYGEDGHLAQGALLKMNPKLYLRKFIWALMARAGAVCSAGIRCMAVLFALWIFTGSLGVQFAQYAVNYFGMGYAPGMILLLVRWVFPMSLLLTLAAFALGAFLWLYGRLRVWIKR